LVAPTHASHHRARFRLVAGAEAAPLASAGFRRAGDEARVRGAMNDHILDQMDRRILRIVQRDASLTIAEIATRIGLSQTPCWKRLQRLESLGVIKRRIAVLDPCKLGLGLTVFISIEVERHSGDDLAHFAASVASIEEVMDVYRVAGDVDYILRVVVQDTAALDALYARLRDLIPLKNVTSRIALENIKSETAFPV
jgi:Lrp/AsnC family transcriptional regulator